MAVNKGKRLSKVAREFNVGVSTIIEFLDKKGVEVDDSPNPNTKISSEAYDVLVKEYSSEIKVKKDSEKLNLRKRREDKETVSIEEDSTDKEESATTPEEILDEVFIKDTSSVTTVAKDLEPKIKVVDKIDLDAVNAPKKETTNDSKPEKVEETLVEEKVTEKVAEKIEPKEEVIAEPEPKVETTPKVEVIEEVAVKAEEVKEVIEVKEEKTSKKVVTPKKVKEEKSPEVVAEKAEEKTTAPVEKVEPVAEKPETVIEKPEPVAEKPVKEEVKSKPVSEETTDGDSSEIRVVGKIDLNALNQKTRPTKKTKKEKEEERKLKIKESKVVKKVVRRDSDNKDASTSNATDTSRVKKDDGPELYKTSFKKLTGPTVVGKIVLPVIEDKKKVVLADGDRKKKKRKRIKKEKVDVSAKAPTKTVDRTKRTVRPAQNVRPKKRIVKQEVNVVDVQKQIKDTLARLTSKGKSKGSKHRRDKREAVSQRMVEETEKKELEKNILEVTEFVTVNELASMMDVPVNQIIATCMNLGMFVSINQRLDAETMTIVADEFNFIVNFVSIEVQEAIQQEEDTEEDLKPRSPIVTVMGHVDHGKTSLLDHIRKANVIAGEAGGITQHIGAYSVKIDDGKQITFLDTPGHEAFTAMRARGAQVTDIAIIVVAADDNIMPQTIEAINHAQAANVPIVFAINKIDKPGANPEKIKEALANMNYLVEEWGGKYQSQDISAKQGLNIDALLEKVLLEAELLELRANANKKAIGTVIESELDKGRGYVSTILVEAGTLKIGDVLLAGSYTGHIKAMFNERGKNIEEAGPSTPVLILGLNGAPQAGDKFNVMDGDREAKEIANKRIQLQREQGLRTQKHITLDEIGRRIAIGNFQELNIIVKGDVDGSIEALSDSLLKLSTEEIQVNIIHKAVGQISEADVMLATASNAIIVGFQVRPSVSARKIAEKEEIDIRLYSIIYDAINEVKDAMEGMLSPEIKEEIISTVEVRETFKITKVGTIAGCMVRDGKINRNSKVRVIRDGIVVYTGLLGSLKRFKDDVKEVATGYECGLNIDKFNDIKIGDIVEGYELVEVKKKL